MAKTKASVRRKLIGAPRASLIDILPIVASLMVRDKDGKIARSPLTDGRTGNAIVPQQLSAPRRKWAEHVAPIASACKAWRLSDPVTGAAAQHFFGPSSKTLLMAASALGHIERMKLLLSAKAEINATTGDAYEDETSRGGGVTALGFALSRGHRKAVRTLVGAGADVNLTLVGLEDVRDEVLEYLPLLRELVSHPSVEGKVAFDVAVRFGLKDKFAELKEVVTAGWDEDDFRFYLRSFDEHSSIWIARQLVGDARYPLDINGQMCLAARMMHEDWLRELSTMKGADPLTLLRAASRCGSLDLISHALQFVSADDINKTDSPRGIGPNLYGSALELARGEPEIVRLFCASDKIDKGLALVVACELGLADLCNSLLERGAPIQGYAATNLYSESGRCAPLTAAAAYGRAEVVKLLLLKKASVNDNYSDAMEQLCSGAGLRHVIDKAPTTVEGLADTLRLLLKAGAVTDVCRSGNCSWDDDGQWNSDRLSAVESVCQCGLVALIKVFVDECGIDVNASFGANPGHSPLEAACLSPTLGSIYGRVEVIHFLRARGAKVSQKLLDETASSLLHRALTDVLKPAEVALELVMSTIDDLERRLAVARDAEREVKAAVSVLQFAEGTMRRKDKSTHLKTAIRMCRTAETARRSPTLIILRTHCES